MKVVYRAFLALLFLPLTTYAQVSPQEVNGARNSAADGTSLDTNAHFSLRMTLSGDDTLRDAAEVGEDVSIRMVINPETEDIGQPADIIIVDYRPPIPFMRNTDGDFVAWNGKLSELVPSQEGVMLTDALDVEVFSGQLGEAGDHRIFVGFLVGDTLYFTPSALRISITETVVPDPGPTAREQAISLFESTISPNIVQGICIQCHVAGGLADGRAIHIFMRTSDPDHLSKNFSMFENLHSVRGTTYILDKVQGRLGGLMGTQLTSSNPSFNDLDTFLQLLDQAGTGSSQALEDDIQQYPVDDGYDDGYDSVYAQ